MGTADTLDSIMQYETGPTTRLTIGLRLLIGGRAKIMRVSDWSFIFRLWIKAPRTILISGPAGENKKPGIRSFKHSKWETDVHLQDWEWETPLTSKIRYSKSESNNSSPKLANKWDSKNEKEIIASYSRIVKLCCLLGGAKTKRKKGRRTHRAILNFVTPKYLSVIFCEEEKWPRVHYHNYSLQTCSNKVSLQR